MKEVKPYLNKEGGKKEQVRNMFNNISGRYDFMNHFLSIGIDRKWRDKSVKLLMSDKPKKILDVATGTGDFALASLKLHPESIVGIDISEKMLEVGNKKIKSRGLENIVNLRMGDSENLDFEDYSFDAVTVGFGVRNFENLKKGLDEMYRVLKDNGKLVVLEFSKPDTFPVKQLYSLYFTKILPAIGSLLSKDKRAYTYLHESVDAFPEGEDFIKILSDCGYKNLTQYKLLHGIASIYVGKK